MSDIVQSPLPEEPEQPGTKVRRFMARRGLLLLKEFREICSIKAEFGQRIVVSTLIIAVPKSSPRKVTYGIRFERFDEDSNAEETAMLDFDETEEFIGAIDFIVAAAGRIAEEARDYTELIYQSKDDIRFGFYQSESEQQPFIRLGNSPLVFLSFRSVDTFKRAMADARQYLISRGAEP